MPYDTISTINENLAESFRGTIQPTGGSNAAVGDDRMRYVFNETYASFDSINRILTNIADAVTQRARIYGDPKAVPATQPAFGIV